MPALSAAGGLGAAGDLFQGLFGGLAGFAEAKGYKQAAGFAAQNAIISQEAGDIKQAQEERRIFKTLGTQAAGYAGAGLTAGGSAQAVLRSSLSQGALEKAIINEQTQINVTGYKAQAAQFSAMAKAAKTGGIGSIIGGVLKAAAVVAPALSDRRL